MDLDKLLAAIDAGKEASYGTDEQSDLGQRRARCIEAYLGLNTNPAPEGRSQVVDRTAYQAVATIMPSLARIFAGSDDICKALPVGPDDDIAAEQTSAVLSHVVTRQNNWAQIFRDWAFDAAVSMNGYALPYWDETKKTTREVYEGQYEDQLAALLSDSNVKVLQHSEYIDEQATKEAQEAYQQQMAQWAQAAQQYAIQGQQPPPQPQPPQPVIAHDVVIERVETEGKVCIKVLPPEHCYVHVETPDWTLKDCPYFEVRIEKTISDLRLMGLQAPEDISDDDDPDDSLEDDARDRFSEDREKEGEGSMRAVWTRMVWVKCSPEPDGEARYYYCILVGRTVLHWEPVSRIPVVSMTMQPLAHRHIGLGLVETALDLQDIRTAIKRGGLDNLYLANNGRHAVSEHVNLADLLDSRPGGIVRVKDGHLPGEGHIVPLAHPLAFDSIIQTLEYVDQEAQNRLGASRYFAGTDAGAINKTAMGTNMLISQAAMRVEDYALQIANSVEMLFDHVHELILKHQNKPLTISLRGKWATVDPQAWRTKRDIKIAVGVGAGNKDAMMAQLQQVLAAQMQIGLPLGLVGREHIQATNQELAKLAGFPNPEKFWPDPEKLPPPQPQMSPEQIKAQADMQKEQFRAQQEQLKFQAEQQIEQQRLMLQAEVDKQREEMQARQKLLETEQSAQLERLKAEMQAQADARRLEFEQWKASLDAAVKLEIANKTAQTTLEGAQISKQPDSRIDELMAVIQELRAEAEAPAELIRDPQTGRATGVKKGNRVRQVVRDPQTGRAVSLQ